MLDSNLVAVSLPSIAHSLGASYSDIQWVVSAYILPFTALLLVAGMLADLWGRKRAMIFGLIVFTAASLICGAAPTAFVLNAGRALQGVGAAFLLTASLAVINHTFRGPERARAYAFWGACLGVAITAGPIVGGLINDSLGWRWAFLVNVPIGIVLAQMAWSNVAESRDPLASGFDRWGAVTLGAALLFLTFALIEGNVMGWTSTIILVCLLMATVMLAVFVKVETLQARPMLDLSLFRSRGFLGAAAAMIGYAASAHVMVFYLPMILQNGFLFAPAIAGLAMLPFALPMFLTPRLLGGRLGALTDRWSLAIGLSLTCLGNCALALASSSSYLVFASAMILAGCGAGILNSETARVLQGTVPPDRGGMASGISATTRFTALLVSVAGLGAVFGHLATKTMTDWAMQQGLSLDLATATARRFAAGDTVDALVHLPADIHASAILAGSQGTAIAFAGAAWVAAFVASLGIITTLVLLTPPARSARQA
jgi:EmrB/QacA subfamily drug resistance transporter